MSTDTRMGRENAVYTMECYATLKKEGNPITCYNMDEPQGHYTK